MVKRKPNRLAAALVLVIWLVPSARADDVMAEAAALYRQGAFREAADLTWRIDDARSLAFAAKATLAYAAYGAPPGEDIAALDRGEQLARAALARDPDNIEALLHLAIALGYQSRVKGYIKSHFAGRAREAAQVIDRALGIDPRHAWSQAAKGAWHAELVAVGGALVVRALYQASAKKAISHYQRAMELVPGNPTIRIEFAKALLRINRRKYLASARDQLAKAMTLGAGDAFEEIIWRQGRRLLDAVEEGDRRKIKAVLEEMEPFGSPVIPVRKSG